MYNSFKFSKAIQSTLTTWTLENVYLNQAVTYPDLLFFWRAGSLYINLNYLSNEFRMKYIEQDLNEYCLGLAALIQEPLSQFLIEYEIPAINMHLEFNYRGQSFATDILVLPELKKVTIMKIMR